MTTHASSVFTIAPGGDFLRVLAKYILEGFPLAENVPKPPLSDWTILLPTRRAARELNTILAELCGRKALLLPRIKPFGDLDEDRLQVDDETGDLPKAISRTGQLFTLLSLLEEWAQGNPQITLARDILSSKSQTLGLATSLLKLITQIETEETNFEKLEEAYNSDLSEHRNAILSIIGLLKIALPQKLNAENLLGSAERRSRLIRLEAQRISRGAAQAPIIAAGSTGTIPATRALLKAIADYPQGAVVLPGLDQHMNDTAWLAITAEHPQYSMKALIGELDVTRQDILLLGKANGNRNWLTSEVMRPSNTAEEWHINLKGRATDMAAAVENIRLIEAPDRHSEARSIALILRHSLETPKQTAALVTPDRDLAKRVKAELTRWDIIIDDSAGEPLIQFGLASLAASLLEAASNEFSPASLISLLYHPLCDLGLGREKLLSRLHQLEIAVLRGYGGFTGLDGLRLAFERARESRRKKLRAHPLVAVLQEEDWQELHHLTLQISAALQPLVTKSEAPLLTHLQIFTSCLNSLAPAPDLAHPENQAFSEIMMELQGEAARHPASSFAAASVVILHMLRTEQFRSKQVAHPRLAIYGVLEARLIPSDIVVLGGLNEGKWPAQPDPGPWLNRTMRGIFGMQQPERDIGVSAHDFTQGLGYDKVYLTWSKRIEGAPQVPSRWILRLQTILQTAGLTSDYADDKEWVRLSELLDEPEAVMPLGKPKPKPPVAARPTRFSVSAVEKLIRDPYAVYAEKILRLESLAPIAQSADAALRGNIFHEAIGNWNKMQANVLASNPLSLLIEEGRKAFAPLIHDPDIASFWWPRFVRMAKWLANQEIEFREEPIRVHAEIEGRIEFDIGSVSHSLTARADRIDVLQSGTARIIDYKTGIPPSNKQVLSGMKPQLPLEAAILANCGFEKMNALMTDQLVFFHISGGTEEGKIIEIKPEKEKTLTETGLDHLSWFKKLLSSYQNEEQQYFPRANMFKEEDISDSDHLSRYAEWILAGEL
jgi:ATP-dependent helicase/nuclease subunit B